MGISVAFDGGGFPGEVDSKTFEFAFYDIFRKSLEDVFARWSN